MTTARRALILVLVIAMIALDGCTEPKAPRRPEDVRAQIVSLLPSRLADRRGWATDLYAAFASLGIEPTTRNLCAALAVTEQESGFNVDPVVPGLPKIALGEIERRALQHDIPAFVVRGALQFSSPDGRSYDRRLAGVRTEQDLSRIYDDFIGSVPLGRRLLGDANPVHTGGPMQVSIPFAERYARAYDYPYPVTGTIRDEVFTRRGGLYFGVAHLLGYPTSYPQALYRFADYNAGFYASRNAAFQQAVGIASGIRIPLDGDLVLYNARRDNQPGATEMAVRSLAAPLNMDASQIHRALQQGGSGKFEHSPLYAGVFILAQRKAGRTLPRAMLPHITLDSPKITRKLTTQWFATKVDQRYRKCLAGASRG
ncbi:MAG: putative lipoprotein [Xanthomonadaceae bacterium]|nr:putative lipoprotein [Xanthomonadaceae bacterium]